MARNKKGRAVSGWVIVDKPAGIGSTTVVGKIRWAFGAQKAGHAGTLDPDATGLLAVALGEATKTVPQAGEGLKTYHFRMALGSATSTDDAAGEVIARSDTRPTDAEIAAALPAFRGQIMQVPPQVSAVKVDGARAYDLARDGVEMDLAARPLWVERLEVIARPDPDHIDLEMICGKGGYVRSIARDLGAMLGCLGHVVWLRRLAAGPFTLDRAVTIDQIEALAKSDAIDSLLQPLQCALRDLPEVMATDDGATRLRHGNAGQVIPKMAIPTGVEVWASHDGKAVAIGHYLGGMLHPTRVFNLD